MSGVPAVTLGLGSNLGNRLANLQAAVDGLAREGVHALACSRVWQTAPVGGPDGQPPYLNAVVRASTGLTPEDVLAAGHRIERERGRMRDVRWGPRTLDVDLLLYDDLVLEGADLTLPHPRIAERGFVVLPLLDIDPDPVLPTGVRLLDRAVEGAASPYAPPLRLP